MSSRQWSPFTFGAMVLSDRDTFLQFLMSNELVKQTDFCDEGHEMKIDRNRVKNGLGSFRCRRKHSDGKEREWSLMRGTWFSNISLKPEKALTLTFMFADDFPFTKAFSDISKTFGGTSKQSVSRWYKSCRKLVCEHMLQEQTEDGLLGGPGKVVEIDESKFGKRKYYVGRIKLGVWIFGMIERESKRFRLLPCPNNKRDAATLLPIIQENILPGTEIHSDKWAAYNQLSRAGYYHFTVNHSQNFVDPDTGAHTQTIEASWRHVKERLYTRGVREENMGFHLTEYLFRRKVRRSELDAFDELLTMIKAKYPVN